MIVGRFTADAMKLREWLPSFLKLYFCNVSPSASRILAGYQFGKIEIVSATGENAWPRLLLLRRERGDDFLEA